jgi:hypothetical protein
MNTIGYDASGASKQIAARRPRWQRFAELLRRFDRDERYSPGLSVAMLLVVGLIVKLAPVIHGNLPHH